MFLLNGSEARACPGVFLFKYAQARLIVRFRRSINDVFRVDESSEWKSAYCVVVPLWLHCVLYIEHVVFPLVGLAVGAKNQTKVVLSCPSATTWTLILSTVNICCLCLQRGSTLKPDGYAQTFSDMNWSQIELSKGSEGIREHMFDRRMLVKGEVGIAKGTTTMMQRPALCPAGPGRK